MSLVTYPRINPYVDIIIWSYPQASNKYATFFPIIYIYLIIYNFKKYDFCQMLYENHRATPFLYFS